MAQIKQAKELKDLINWSYWWRYFKKAVTLSILYTIIWTVISWILLGIARVLGIVTQESTLMAVVEAGGVVIGVIILVGLLTQTIIAGFVMEYIQNAKNRLMKWVQQ